MSTLTSSLVVRLLDQVSGPAKKVAASLRGLSAATRLEATQARLGAAIQTNNAALAAARGRVVDAAAAFYVLKNAITSPVRAAMEFESAMADVRKVVDFPSPEAFKDFQKQIIDMSKDIPMAAQGLTEIVAAAGQAGIAGDDLLKFTELAAKVGVAFDISADQAGDALAKMMTALDFSLGEIGALTDAMNHLSNAQASSAADILDVMRRAGSAGKLYGFTAVQTAAFASAMLSAGAESDVAATGFRNMGKALVRGASATKAQRRAYKALGLDAKKTAKAMQKDAVATTVDVLERIGKLPKEVQNSIATDLFGDEARALMPLIANLDLLKRSLGLVADETDYLGSSQREYEVRAKTFANASQLFSNRLEAMKIAIGAALIPALNDMMLSLAPVIEAISDFATANPELVSNIAMAAAAVVAFSAASAGLSWMLLSAKGGVLGLSSAMVGISRVALATSSLMAAPFVAATSRLVGAFRTVPVAAEPMLATFSRVNQATKTSAAVNAAASAAMIRGMNSSALAAATASNRMIAGMSSAGVATVTLGSRLRGLAGAAVAGLGAIPRMAFSAAAGMFRVVGATAVVRGAMMALKLAVIGTGIGAVLVGIATAGTWIYRNWSGIQTMFEGIGEGIRAAFPGAGPIIDTISSAVGKLVGWFDQLTGKIDASDEEWRAFGVSVGTAIGEAITKVAEFPAQAYAALVGAGAAFYEAGAAMMQQLWEGMKALAGQIVSWAAGIGGDIASAISSAAAGAVDSVKSALGFGGTPAPASSGGGSAAPAATPAVDGARASGGPVRRGGSYLVGEEGMEIFKPDRNGSIVPNDQLGAGGGRGQISAPFTANLTVHVNGSSMSPGEVQELVKRAVDDSAREHERRLREILRGIYSDSSLT